MSNDLQMSKEICSSQEYFHRNNTFTSRIITSLTQNLYRWGVSKNDLPFPACHHQAKSPDVFGLSLARNLLQVTEMPVRKTNASHLGNMSSSTQVYHIPTKEASYERSLLEASTERNESMILPKLRSLKWMDYKEQNKSSHWQSS